MEEDGLGKQDEVVTICSTSQEEIRDGDRRELGTSWTEGDEEIRRRGWRCIDLEVGNRRTRHRSTRHDQSKYSQYKSEKERHTEYM